MTAKIALLPDTENNLLPLKATIDSAGIDLRANLEEPLKILKGTGARVGTGVRVRISRGFCCFVLPRSGLGGAPHYLTITNAPGLIDPDYDEEIFVTLFCLGSSITIKPGDRIAQLICVPGIPIEGHYSLRLEPRTGGAGSTGVS